MEKGLMGKIDFFLIALGVLFIFMGISRVMFFIVGSVVILFVLILHTIKLKRLYDALENITKESDKEIVSEEKAAKEVEEPKEETQKDEDVIVSADVIDDNLVHESS